MSHDQFLVERTKLLRERVSQHPLTVRMGMDGRVPFYCLKHKILVFIRVPPGEDPRDFIGRVTNGDEVPKGYENGTFFGALDQQRECAHKIALGRGRHVFLPQELQAPDLSFVLDDLDKFEDSDGVEQELFLLPFESGGIISSMTYLQYHIAQTTRALNLDGHRDHLLTAPTGT
jgi:hypothetical protein